jgi:hypothetical protein
LLRLRWYGHTERTRNEIIKKTATDRMEGKMKRGNDGTDGLMNLKRI